MPFWYYADSHNQQQGPVDASLLRARAERGELPPSTLVWREGMAGWVPLSQVAGELGVELAGAPPPLPAGTSGPVRIVPPSGGSSAWVIVLVLVLGGFFVLGIFAAIAIPAYSDYTSRAKVSQGLVTATALKLIVAEVRLTDERCPGNGSDGIGTPESYADAQVAQIHVGGSLEEGCTIRIVYKDLGSSQPAGGEVVMTFDGESNWSTTSTIPDRYLPASLRGGRR